MSHTNFLRVIAAAAVLVITACTVAPKVFVNEDPGTNFATYRTYNFESVLGTDKPKYNSILSTYLKDATRRQMESRGYVLSDNPDLLINFYVYTKEVISSTPTTVAPVYGGYYGYRSGYYGGYAGYDNAYQITQYTEGTLNIDLVDREKKQLIWETAVVGRITNSDRENLQQTVDEAVLAGFDRFTHRAGTAEIFAPKVEKDK